MQQMSANWLTDMTAPSRIVEAKVEVYKDSTLTYTFLPEDYLSLVQISRDIENGGVFGYTICQKATVEVIDVNNAFSISKGDSLKIFLGTETELAKNPTFYVEEIKRDEVKNNISIVAYDVINKSTKSYFKDLTITYPITLTGYADLVATYLGTSAVWKCITGPMEVSYPEEAPPNLGGDETLRQVLAALAEVTGTICYVDAEDKICFKQLGGDSVLDIDKEVYFEFKLGESLLLKQISQTNELGDFAFTMGDTSAGGYHYIMRGNPFIEGNAVDPADILNHIINSFVGQPIYAYDLKWRGNPALEIGDKVTLTQHNDSTVDIFYLGETLTYNGGMVATSSWSLGEEEDIDSPPATVGDAIKKTFAKVDKVNNEITLVAAQVEATNESVSSLALTTDGISASVKEVETALDESMTAMNEEMTELSRQVSLGMSVEDVQIAIKSELANGVDKVTTATGFTFNEEGLTVSKSTSDITTQITEDGMTVSKGSDVVLTANNEGVVAEDLHATTYLIIGNNSRFEDFINTAGEARTGCFWIGG